MQNRSGIYTSHFLSPEFFYPKLAFTLYYRHTIDGDVNRMYMLRDDHVPEHQRIALSRLWTYVAQLAFRNQELG